MSALGYILIFGIMGAFGVSVIWALWWALQNRQFMDPQRGAASIFDEDEPIGLRTDAFPDEPASGRNGP